MATGSKLDNKKIRVDDGAFRLLYPTSSDSRGRARVTIKRKSYYFGEHGSPQSYAMFAMWVADLEGAEGAPLKPSAYRDAAFKLLRKRPRWWHTPLIFSTAILLSALVVSGAVVSNAWFSSSEPVAQVDGLDMTARESEYIRALRNLEQMQVARSKDAPSRVAERYAKFMSKEGPLHAPPPRISAKPPIDRLD